MRKQINIDNSSILRGKERIPFEKINAKLITLGWDSSIELDPNYGWCILAIKSFPSSGVELRRIKPFKITSYQDLFFSIKLQQKLKSELVEIVPFKIYKGDRVFFSEISDYMDFMSEAKIGLFRKFFQTLQFSLNDVDSFEADKNNNG